MLEILNFQVDKLLTTCSNGTYVLKFEYQPTTETYFVVQSFQLIICESINLVKLKLYALKKYT